VFTARYGLSVQKFTKSGQFSKDRKQSELIPNYKSISLVSVLIGMYPVFVTRYGLILIHHREQTVRLHLHSALLRIRICSARGTNLFEISK
jgi:hypothetical protein